ncbi:MAG: LLM class F420-dependent oxidoreductase [Caulobacteraceae bacterium]|nr:LLM class F420-dependent oxidoreductase [Caulobacteraceae bacterium]
MRIGCTFPQSDIGNDPVAIRDFAQAAEALGYTHIMIYDHVLGAVHEGRDPPLTGPYTENSPFHEPMVTYGFLAAVTSKIELCTGIVILPQRQTALVAKQAAEVDILSGGRLRLGVGTGWNPVEYEGLGMGWEDRGDRYEEQIALVRRLWDEPVIDFRGKFHRIDRAGILPRPSRRIPIWMGGAHDRVLRRAARLADGFMFSRGGPRSLESARQVRDYVAAEGRDASKFGVEGILNYSDGPDLWAERLESWRQAGASHACVRTMDEQPIGPATQILAIRRYAEAVGLKSGS